MRGRAGSFFPFYERWAAQAPGYLIGELGVALSLGGGFLALRAWAVGAAIFADWSWLLALLIAAAMLCLSYATHTLHGLLPEMSLVLRKGGGEANRDAVFMAPIERLLSDRRFIVTGVGFGVFNCAVGAALGAPCERPFDCATLFFGFFLAGFVCGMAVQGICGVTVALTEFGRHAKAGLDYSAPDRCGGVQFVGEGLVVFSSVGLIGGVLISLYILNVPWTHDRFWLVNMLEWFWIAFPFLLSLVILMAPAVPLNEALRQYKVEQEARLQEELARISASLKSEAEPLRRKELRDQAAEYQAVRKDLHTMGTWPHGISANLKYLGIFLANMLASANTVQSVLPKLLHW
jgi:hypothetical protein